MGDHPRHERHPGPLAAGRHGRREAADDDRRDASRAPRPSGSASRREENIDPYAGALALASAIAERSPDSVAATKRLFNRTWTASDRRTFRWERLEQARLLMGANAAEARRAATRRERPAYEPRAGIDPRGLTPVTSGKREPEVTTPAHHLRAVRGVVRARGAGARRRRSSASRATPRTRSRAGTSAPRASRCRTSTPTPTGCVARSSGSVTTWVEIGWDEAIELAADLLARRAGAARARRRRDLPRQPQRPQPRRPDPRHGHPAGAAAAGTSSAPRASTSCRTTSWRGRCTATSSSCPSPTSTAPGCSSSSGRTRWRRTGRCGRCPTSPAGCASCALAVGGSSSSTRGAPRRRRSPTSTTSSGPGTDATVLLALVHVVLAEGLARPAAYVDGLDELRVARRRLHAGARRVGERGCGTGDP